MLRLENIGKTYPSGTQALAHLTLSVRPAEILAVVGGSGCGKSTLLRLIAGLDRPSAGRVDLDGEAITAPHPAVGVVFQEPRLLAWLTVAQNIGFGIAHLPRAERAARVELALQRIGLAAHGERWPRELSGGQAQRVALARALIAQPRVLLLDEPFSALDAFTRADLQEHLLALWEDTRPTLVLVTHDIDEALLLADRIVVMQPNPGRVASLVSVELPRPREPGAPDFEALKRQILNVLGPIRRQTAMPAAAE
ncbi:ABC transporter related protein [Ancylobacter novellus DSM 506]|uniref:ABC transporter related protein n=1 Tax=Ancylobacter novellus (strain ATCC 8093 / DSM 506 / JCM 20403 / CCM 1077 / IAM 12100 / NBRC 12443 / NCIMB 10456) TaxID=639283 RepID=D7A633_ANCN5|nr:ABC transporter ATP-binding protein [Ancylobacter novellus]ADH88183.1 ABC transporter related protein [Ancylobacter novellus DSM 506]